MLKEATAGKELSLPALAWPATATIAAVKIAFDLATAGFYSAHRDEFYYLAGGHHLSWGYVDHPPLVPVLYRVGEILFGHSTEAMHVLPAFLGGLYILLAVLLAREFGGGRFAQVLAALVAAVAPLYLTTTHFLSTVSLDIVAWAIASLLLARMVRKGDRRLWLLIGLTVGIGLMNKHTLVFWVLGAGIGLLATPQRRLLWSWWTVAGAALALAIFSPNLVWQFQHDWATLQFLQHVRQGNASSDRSQFVPLQLLIMTLAGTIVWIAALLALARRPEWSSQRWLAIGFLALFVTLFALGGKAYYLGSWYLPLVAIGSVVLERRWQRATARWALPAAVVVTGLLVAPVFTPVLPESTVVALHLDTTNKDLGGMLGWPSLVNQVAAVFHSLPASEQESATILTRDYSEAGAINFWRDRLALPAAISGHNSYWLWGYGDASNGTVVVVGLSKRVVDSFWADVEPAGTLGADGAVIDPQERGLPIWICRQPKVSWAVIWPQLRAYN